MDPVSGAILAGAAGQLLADGVKRAGRVAGKPLTQDDISLQYPVFDEFDDLILVLNQHGLEVLNSVLRDSRSAVLIEARGLGRLIISDASLLDELLAELRQSFIRVGQSIAGDLLDVETLVQIWARLGAQQDAVFSDENLTRTIESAERVALEETQNRLILDSDRAAKVPIWLRELAKLAGDLELLQKTDQLRQDVRRAASAAFTELRIDHALEEVRRSIQELYIPRVLRSPDGRSTSTEKVFGAAYRNRIVVTGPPGGGKSTLTQHLLYSISESESSAAAPVRVRVREISVDNPLLVDEIVKALRRDYQLGAIERRDIETLLELGRAYIVFDGLDEVLEIASRRRLIERIEAFARRYPLCSIMVTSRDVGYEEAALSAGLFNRYRILPFTDSQVEAYARAWFEAETNGDSLVRSFVRDVGVVPDLRMNPLMLSLLCTLYKARGHIPRNRRHVYLTCADLLFNRWDSMRQIDQPVDHIEHGQDLMQDIALFFYQSRTAQEGVQERQLQRIIANFLRDTAGVLPASADHRARQFLEFCAGRAWLLGKAGNTASGERLFIFTHQTFMEFFAAEGMVRSSRSTSLVAEEVCASYRANPSAVLPELIVSAAEASRRGAAREIAKAIKAEDRLLGGRGIGRYLPLRLRIAGVLALQPSILDEIVADAFRYLDRTSLSDSIAVRSALFDLPRDARARVTAFLFEPGELGQDTPDAELGQRQAAFLRSWLQSVGRDAADVNKEDWEAAVATASDLLLKRGEVSDPLIRSFAAVEYRDRLSPGRGDLHFMVRADKDLWIPSLAARTVERAIHKISPDKLDLEVCSLFHTSGPPGYLHEQASLSFITSVLREVLDDQSSDEWLDESFGPVRPLALSAGLLYCEIYGEDREADVVNPLSRLCLQNLDALLECRNLRTAPRRRRLTETQRDVVMRASERSGPWLAEWVEGRLSMVEEDFS